MKIFKELRKKGYRHYYGGTLEELDLTTDDDLDLYSELMLVVLWLYEKYKIWISIDILFETNQTGFWYCIRESKDTDHAVTSNKYDTPVKAYKKAIEYCLNNLILKKN